MEENQSIGITGNEGNKLEGNKETETSELVDQNPEPMDQNPEHSVQNLEPNFKGEDRMSKSVSPTTSLIQNLPLPKIPILKTLKNASGWKGVVVFVVLLVGFWIGLHVGIWHASKLQVPDLGLVMRFVDQTRKLSFQCDELADQGHEILREFYHQGRNYWALRENVLREEHKDSLAKMQKLETEMLGAVYASPRVYPSEN